MHAPLTIRILCVPAEPNSCCGKELGSELLEVLVAVSVGEKAVQDGEIPNQVLPDSVRGLIHVRWEQAKDIHRATNTSSSLQIKTMAA